MANAIQWGTPEAVVSVLTTELNALASNGASVASSAQSQTNEYTFADYELTVTFAAAPAAGQRCVLYTLEALDGTNYNSIDADLSSQIIAVFLLDASASLQR